MLNKTVVFLFLFVVLSSTALAEISVDVSGNDVTITGTCDAVNSPVALQAAIGVNTVWFDQVVSDDTGVFNALFTAPQDGTYTLLAACENEVAEQVDFCVGESCVGVDGDDDPTPVDGEVSPGGGGSNGGGFACFPKWNCDAWSYCDVNLEETRTCFDQTNCKEPKVETRGCERCDESWICSEWSDCSNGVQTRTCVDEHSCTTVDFKPAESRGCSVTAPSSDVTAPASGFSKVVAQIQKPISNIWSNYQNYVVWGGALLLFIIVLIVVIVHVTRKKHYMAYNFDELRTWIHKEASMGTSNEDIKDILSEHTGWTEKEIEKAFSELNGN